MAAPRLVEFELLPPPARKRFVDATRRMGYPQPILTDTRGGGVHPIVWIGLALFGALILLLAVTSRYGDVYGYKQHGLALVAYALGFFSILAGAVYTAVAILRGKALPYPRGVYVFPTELVDARTKTLRLLPLDELVDARPFTPTQLILRFADGFWHTFGVIGPQGAHQALYAISAARAAVQDASARGDMNMRAALDPFFDARMHDAWQSSRPEEGLRASAPPSWARFAWAGALGAAVLVSIPTWFVRNVLSDGAAFAAASRIDSVYDYEGYLRGNGRHADEVKTHLLPAAALRDAKKAKTVAAMQEYLTKYPGSVYDTDAKKALADAYVYELGLAKAKGTVTALRDFLAAYPDCAVAGEAKDAIHALFQKTLGDFQAKASNGDPAMMPFVKALLTYLEANGSPPVSVRFTRKNAASLAVADQLLVAAQKDEPSVGGVATASDHFDAKHAVPREQAIVTSMQNGFAAVFPADVLTLQTAGATPSPAPATTATTTTAPSKPPALPPTMDITYDVGWSGTTYHGETSDRDFVGIVIGFKVEMHVPGAPAAKRCPPTPPKPWEHPAAEAPGALCPLAFMLDVSPPEHFTVSYDELAPEFRTKAILGGPSDEQVYDVMAARAFDELAGKLMDVFFATRPTPRAPAANAAPESDSDDDDPPPSDDDTPAPTPTGTSL